MSYLFDSTGSGIGTFKSSWTSSRFLVLKSGVESRSLSSTILRGNPLLMSSSACQSITSTQGSTNLAFAKFSYSSNYIFQGLRMINIYFPYTGFLWESRFTSSIES